MATLRAKCPALEKVNLERTSMTEEALAALAEACGQLPTLKELYFYDNRKLLASRGGGQTLGTILAKCPALEKIN